MTMGHIVNKIGRAAALENLAEEASELAQAALKMARVIRKENPTPIRLAEAHSNLVEEYTDVYIMGTDLGLYPEDDLIEEKRQRFDRRWAESNK